MGEDENRVPEIPMPDGGRFKDKKWLMMTVIGLYLIMLLAVIVIIILYCIFLSKVFKKAGVAGWKALVPFYTQYLIAKLALGQGFWFFLIFIPYVGLIILANDDTAQYNGPIRF